MSSSHAAIPKLSDLQTWNIVSSHVNTVYTLTVPKRPDEEKCTAYLVVIAMKSRFVRNEHASAFF